MKKFAKILALFMMFIGSASMAHAASVTFNIDEGATLEEFNGVFTISIADASEITINDYAYYYLYRVGEDNATTMLASNSAAYNAETKVLTVAFPSYNFWPDFPVQTSGNYRISIPADAYTVDGDANVAADINFTIDAPEKFITKDQVTIDPATANFEEVIPQIVITLPEKVTSVNFNEVAAGSSDYYGKISGKAQFGMLSSTGDINSSLGEYNIEVDGNKLILTPAETLTDSDLRGGQWGLRILRNSMYFNGDPELVNETMLFGPYVYPQFLSMEVVPASGSKLIDASKFVVKVSSGETNLVVDENITSQLYKFDDESSDYVPFCNLTASIVIAKNSWGYDEAQVELTPAVSEPLAYGKYKVVMPKGAVKTTDAEPVRSSAVSAEYEYIQMPSIDRTPVWSIEEGASLAMFTEVTMTFPEATEINYVGRYNYDIPITINKVEDDVVTPLGYNGQLSASVSGNQVRLSMNEYNFSGMYPLDMDGDYRIIVPAGNFAFEGVDVFTNEEQILNFKIDAPDPVITQQCASIDPAPSIVKHLANTFTVTLDGVEGEITIAEVTKSKFDQEYGGYVDYVDKAGAELVCNYSYGAYAIGEYSITVEGNRLILTPGENLTADGYWDYADYDIVIPKGILIVNGDENQTNERISFGKYTIEHLVELSVSEPQTEEVESLSTFVLSSDVYSAPTQTDASLITISKWDDATEQYVVMNNAVTSEAQIDSESDMCVFTLSLANEVTEAGKYKIAVARGAYVWEDYRETYTNGDFVAEFEILAAKDPMVAFMPVAVDPVAGNVDALTKITLTFDEQYFPEGLWCDEGAVAKVYDATDAQTVVASARLTADNAAPKVYIEFAEEFRYNGTVNVVIESGLISDYADEQFVNTAAIVLTYTMEYSGINDVEMGGDARSVVTLNGIVLKQNASMDDVNALVPGVYIINGKKVVIRK